MKLDLANKLWNFRWNWNRRRWTEENSHRSKILPEERFLASLDLQAILADDLDWSMKDFIYSLPRTTSCINVGWNLSLVNTKNKIHFAFDKTRRHRWRGEPKNHSNESNSVLYVSFSSFIDVYERRQSQRINGFKTNQFYCNSFNRRQSSFSLSL